MGWKAFKDAYSITHIVCVTDKGVCIGSPYVHDLAVIDMQSGSARENEAFGRFLEQNYPELAAASPEEILAYIQAEDVFTCSIPVFTYVGAEIIERLCEAPKWPNVTHDGYLMHDNQYHTDREQVIAWAKNSAELEEKHLKTAIERVQEQLSDLQARHSNARAAQQRLAADHPSVPAAPEFFNQDPHTMSDQSANPVLFIVARMTGGFAREDASTVDIVGCYTDENVARKVSLSASAQVIPTKLNTLHAGLMSNLKQLGLELDLEALACTIHTQGLIEASDEQV